MGHIITDRSGHLSHLDRIPLEKLCRRTPSLSFALPSIAFYPSLFYMKPVTSSRQALPQRLLPEEERAADQAEVAPNHEPSLLALSLTPPPSVAQVNRCARVDSLVVGTLPVSSSYSARPSQLPTIEMPAALPVCGAPSRPRRGTAPLKPGGHRDLAPPPAALGRRAAAAAV